MTEKLPTINLKGKEYVQVKDRILFFNSEYGNGAIRTEVTTKQDGSYAWFTAIVTPDVKSPERVFSARSAGPVDEEKSYEKLETVAVGRALAFMGIGVIESIASADETKVYQERQTKPKPDYKGTQYANRPSSKATDKTEFEEGDELKTGEKNGKKWYGLKKASGEMVWLKEQQYEYLLGNQAEEIFDAKFEDGSPLPTPFN